MLLHHDTDPERFAGLFQEYRIPVCYEVFDAAAITDAFARSRAYGREENRAWLARHLENYDPTSSFITSLVDEWRHPESSRTAYSPSLVATFVLADLGEENLASIVDLQGDPHPVVRERAIWTLRSAAKDPLFLSTARSALQRATTDPNPDVAASARSTLDEFERQSRRGSEALESMLVRASRGSLSEIRRLGRRVIGCASPLVPMVLKRLATMEGWQHAHVRYTASRALADLERRCPTAPGSTQPR